MSKKIKNLPPAKSSETAIQSPAAVATVSTAPAHNGQPISDDAIRLHAYLKWEATGRPQGDSVRFWLEAEHELSHAN